MTIERGVLNINTAKPWSKMDDQDPELYFVKGETVPYAAVARAAEFLCRNQVEVRARLRELGYVRCRRPGSGRPRTARE
jgi:hypothetical protein